jgi:hypothetical protein
MSVTRERIEEILTETGKQGFYLTDCGNEVASGGIKMADRTKGYDLKRIEMLMKLIGNMWESTDNLRKTVGQNVYGMKQEAADVSKLLFEVPSAYVCVGDFTMAMLLCGFKLVPDTWRDRNVTFYFKLKPGYEAFLELAQPIGEPRKMSSKKYKKLERKAQEWIDENKI